MYLHKHIAKSTCKSIIFFVGIDNSSTMTIQFQSAYENSRIFISLHERDLIFAITIDNFFALSEIESRVNYDVESYVVAYRDIQIPNTYCNPGDWEKPVSASDILKLNLDLKDLFGCIHDRLVVSTKLFKCWKDLLSSYLRR